jgi:hypothetical protein
MISQPDGSKHFNEATVKATLDRQISIYKTAGGFAHMPNPYKSNVEKLAMKKKICARIELEKEVLYLKSIIWEHAKIGLAWQPNSDSNELEQCETAWVVIVAVAIALRPPRQK